MQVYVMYTVEEKHIGVESRMNVKAYVSEDECKKQVDMWNETWIGDGYADYDILELAE
jgi:hypothetical protein